MSFTLVAYAMRSVGKSLVTNATLERLVSGMTSQMGCQIVLGEKSFVAILALMFPPFKMITFYVYLEYLA